MKKRYREEFVKSVTKFTFIHHDIIVTMLGKYGYSGICKQDIVKKDNKRSKYDFLPKNIVCCRRQGCVILLSPR